MRRWSCLRDGLRKEKIEETAEKESLDDPDTLEWMSRYVAETRMFLATLKSDLSLVDNRQQKPEN